MTTPSPETLLEYATKYGDNTLPMDSAMAIVPKYVLRKYATAWKADKRRMAATEGIVALAKELIESLRRESFTTPAGDDACDLFDFQELVAALANSGGEEK